MVNNAETPWRAQSRLQVWLRIDEATKPRLHEELLEAADMGSLNYWLEIFFSAGIATFGLVLNSPAVIIGAMLISPLMGPIMAVGLALAIGDLYLGFKAVLKLVSSTGVAIAFSALLVWLLPFHSMTSELLARTNPNLLDLGIALLSGLAGSVIMCRGAGAGGVMALPGVAIAVALMPPLCTMGFGLGSEMNLVVMGGAGLLFLTNLVAIVASGFVIFILVGMNAPEVTARIVTPSQPASFLRFFKGSGQLRWRILMLVVLLAAIAVPLRKALMQVASETVARGVVQDEMKRLVPPGALVSQHLQLGSGSIVVRLISTTRIPDTKIADARQEIMRRTGRDVTLLVDAVASKQELAELMDRMSTPVPPSPKEKSIAEVQQDLISRIRPAVEDVWPSADAPLQDFALILGQGAASIQVTYQATVDLGTIPLNMILKDLRARLSVPDLSLTVKRISPPSATGAKNRSVTKK